jgi:mediator of RNA polymerase II transcription subunit 23
MEVVVELYEMLGKVDSTSDIQHLNTISDFFYHIKYMFTGDAVKNDIERCIRNFKPRLQYCLRFITHLNISNELLMKHD